MRLLFLAICIGFACGCSRGSSPTPPLTIPAAWGPAIEDKTDDWSGQMAGTEAEVIDRLVKQYATFSATTRVEERSDHHAVLRFDFADLTRGMAREAGMQTPPAGKPLNRRLLIEVSPAGRNFSVRLRSFDIKE